MTTFVLAKEVVTRHYDDKPEVIREFDVVDAVESGDIHSETIAHGTRTRRFLIERVRLYWWTTAADGKDRFSVSVTGRTVLANGHISARSTGFATYWRDGDAPSDIAALADRQHAEVTHLRSSGQLWA